MSAEPRATKGGNPILRTADVSVPAQSLETLEELSRELINEFRRSHGRAPYLFLVELKCIAADHSYDMAMGRYCSHYSPQGVGPISRIAESGLRFRAFGENLCLLTLPAAPETLGELAAAMKEAHVGFLNSPGHRALILEPNLYTHVAVGVAVVENRVGITQLFVTPNLGERNDRLRSFWRLVRSIFT